MAEQEPQYHPAVDEIMETSGPDIGRVKDKTVARSSAIGEIIIQSEGRSPEDLAVYHDLHLKREIALRAVGQTGLAEHVANVGMGNRAEVPEELTAERLKANVEGATKNASEAVASYDALQEVSKPANLTQDHEYLKNNLAQARKKIAEQDGGSTA